MREFDWISTYLKPLCTNASVSAALQDDTASLTLEQNEELVISTDTIIETVHFFPNTHATKIAIKALGVNLSDMAASGATPAYYSLALSLTETVDTHWMQDFANGLKQQQTHYGLSLIGGDTTKTPGPLAITITIFGLVPKGKKLNRSGAQPNDNIYITGRIGESTMGLHALHNAYLDHEHQPFITRYENPAPPYAFGQTLVDHATACMDISDGLAQDLEHLCLASDLGATIQLNAIPIASPTSKLTLSIEELITGGDDYELLFTAPKNKHDLLMQHSQTHQTSITIIGEITSNKTIRFLHQSGQELSLTNKGYQHL